MWAGVREICKYLRVRAESHYPPSYRKGPPERSCGLWGKVAITAKAAQEGRSPGDKYCHLCLFPPFSFLLAIPLDDPNGPQKAWSQEM